MNDHKEETARLSTVRDKHLYLPFVLFAIYIVVTILFFLFGPIGFYNGDLTYLGIFMIGFMFCAAFSYRLGISKKIRIARYTVKGVTANKLLRICVWYALALQLAVTLENSVTLGISLRSFDLSNYFESMAATYTAQENYTTRSLWVLSYTEWARVIALTCGAYTGLKTLNKTEKLAYFGIIILQVINNVLFIGSQKEIVDLLPYVILPYFIGKIAGAKKISIQKKLLFVVTIALVIWLFGTTLLARRELWKEMFASNSLTWVNQNHWLFKILPYDLAMAVTLFMHYICQGYRGLALCLQLPFEWSMGMGSSFKMMNDVSRWFNIPLAQLENSYPIRMEQAFGVKAYAAWHTIFPWLASDFTWIGAIIVVSAFIYLWAKCWREMCTYGTMPAVVLFCHLTILVMYIPCNNQLFQTRNSIVSTLMITVLWFVFHGKTENGSNQFRLKVNTYDEKTT